MQHESGIVDEACGEVPDLGEAGICTLPPRSLVYLNARSVLELSAMALAVGGALLWAVDGGARVPALIGLGALYVVGLVVELPLLNRRRVRFTSYSVGSEFIYITRGAVVRRSVLLPLRQILNVETVQGPLLRRFGFAKVRFSCITDVESLGPLDPFAVADIRRAVGHWRAVD